jgi:hypothetical protein
MSKSGALSIILFEETQSRINKNTIRFFCTVAGIVLAALAINLLLQKGKTTEFSYLLLTILTILIILNIVLPFNLTTQIRSDGIYVRFPPLQPLFTEFYWTDISDVYVRNYNALSEYFGYGIRISHMGTGYIVAGNTGIQIIFKNGNKVLITTQKPSEVNKILRNWYDLKLFYSDQNVQLSDPSEPDTSQ